VTSPTPDDVLVTEAVRVLGAAPDDVTALAHGAALTVTRGVWRVRGGSASAICKLVGEHASAPDGETDFRYWRREPLMYAQGLPAAFAGAGLRMPSLLGSFERTDGSIALWLEDVAGAPGSVWAPDAFGDLARRLGVAQALSGRRTAEVPSWYSRRFLTGYLRAWDHVDERVLEDDAAWAHPLVAPHVTPRLRDGLLALRRDRELFLTALESSPQTFCHLDLWPNNVIRARDSLVLIDWGFAGIAAIGEDIGNLVPDSVFDLLQPASALPELDRVVFDSYVEGLREAGWDGDERQVRLAMCASAVKYCWLAPVMLARAIEGRHRAYGGADLDDPAPQYAARFAGLDFLVGWADEARQLLAEGAAP
jgi:hypothetical protein